MMDTDANTTFFHASVILLAAHEHGDASRRSLVLMDIRSVRANPTQAQLSAKTSTASPVSPSLRDGSIRWAGRIRDEEALRGMMPARE